jgi:hypothetical protein
VLVLSSPDSQPISIGNVNHLLPDPKHSSVTTTEIYADFKTSRLFADSPSLRKLIKTAKYSKNTHYEYGFYGYKGYLLDGVAVDYKSVGDIILISI